MLIPAPRWEKAEWMTDIKTKISFEADWLILVSEGGDSARLPGLRAGGQLGGGETEVQGHGHVVRPEPGGGDDESPRVRDVGWAEVTSPGQLSSSPRQTGQLSNR